jgi:uncharacterized protein YprB with RNaseH-like and TPR domain
MSELSARLARLRKEAGIAAAPAPAPAVVPAGAHDHGLRDTLRRLAGVRERAVVRAIDRGSRDVPGDELAPGLRYIEKSFHEGEGPADLDLSFARMEGAARDRMLAFDTETTGLAGGTGTRAFMIGVADWQGAHLRVRQLYITTLGGEAAMLREFARWVSPGAVLVSYNGKSYDAPLLATRYRLARQDNPLAGLPHVDLLHPMRRRYRQVWENCRLATAERQLLNVMREDDLPGSEAPQAWLGYLRGGSSRNLVRVAEHNLQDLRSLCGLLMAAHAWPHPVIPAQAGTQREEAGF